MIVLMPIIAVAAQAAPPPAPPAPPRLVEDAPGYVSRCDMATGPNGRRYTATVTVAAGKKRRATIVSDAPDLLPPGTYRTDGVIRGGFRLTGRSTNEDIRIKRGGGFLATSAWSNQSGEGNLVVRPSEGSLTDPRASFGKCRIVWGGA